MSRQSHLPIGRLVYECANPECFFCESLLPMEEVVWKDYWNSTLKDLDVRPACPSCEQPMMSWEDENGT
jgi:hypothetical protein